MNLKVKLISLLILLLLFTGCRSNKTSSYISYTQTRQENDKLISSIYYYDLKNQPEKIYEFEYNSGYPLGVYDKLNQVVYYTQKQNNINTLMKYDIKKKEVSSISTRTSAINDIVLLKNNSLLIVSYDKEEENHNMYPFIYDTSTKSLKRLEINPTISITDIKYDFDSNTIYFAGWLKDDEDKIIQEKEGYNIPLQRYIYSYQLNQNKLELIYKGESQFNTFAIDFKSKSIYIANKEQKIIKFNLITKESTLSTIQDVPNIIHIEGNDYYYISKNLLFNSKENISNIKDVFETVNNAIFIKQNN